MVDELRREDLGRDLRLAAIADLIEKAADERLVALAGHRRSPFRVVIGQINKVLLLSMNT